ncbi:hypothetical protein DPMN_049759, partial [Dreissena polymorpha]
GPFDDDDDDERHDIQSLTLNGCQTIRPDTLSPHAENTDPPTDPPRPIFIIAPDPY